VTASVVTASVVAALVVEHIHPVVASPSMS